MFSCFVETCIDAFVADAEDYVYIEYEIHKMA